MTVTSDSDSSLCSVLGLHNCNKLAVLGLYQAPLHLGLSHTLGSHLTFPQCLGLEVVFLPVPGMQVSYPSLIRSYVNCTRHDLLINKKCRRAVVVSIKISTANGNCQSHVSQPPDIQFTIAQFFHVALPQPLAIEALVPLLQHGSQILDNDPYHAPDLCILCTKLLRVPMAEMFCPSSNFSFRNKSFSIAQEYAEPPYQHPTLVSHALSL